MSADLIRYSPKRSTVELMGRAFECRVLLAVRDRGPGVPAELLPHIFERYVHGRPRLVQAGLGLAISREFMHAMGGDIDCTSTKGQGATFSLSFVANDPPDAT